MKEEAKIYLRKRLPKLKIAVGLVTLFTIIIIIYTLKTGDFRNGAFLLSMIAIPSAIMCLIHGLVLYIKSDEISGD